MNTKTDLQTCALDGSNMQPFDGNYNDFPTSDVSPDGKLFIGRSSVYDPSSGAAIGFELFLFTARNKRLRPLMSGSRDLDISDFKWSKDSDRVALEAEHSYTRVSKDGYALTMHNKGIWIIGKDGKNLRQIATDASLVTWLH